MNDYRAYVECDYNSIYHHGIKGQEWGVRRFQNPDGSLTPEGKRRYSQNFYNELRSVTKDRYSGKNEEVAEIARRNIGARITKEQLKKLKASEDKFYNAPDKNWTYDKEADQIANNILNNMKNNFNDEDVSRIKKNYLEYCKQKYHSSESNLKKISSDIDKSLKRNLSAKDHNTYKWDNSLFEAVLADKETSKKYWDEIAKAKADYDKRYAKEQKIYSDSWKELVNTKKEIINDVLGTYANQRLYNIYNKDTIIDILSDTDPSFGFYIDYKTLSQQGGKK